MDNTATQPCDENIIDNKDEVVDQNINYEIKILQNNDIKEMKEVCLKNDCVQMDVSKEDKPAPQLSQEWNVSCQKDKMENKEVHNKRSISKKRLRNTRGTMHQMNSESMTELRKITKQHQTDDSINIPQTESIETSQGDDQGINHLGTNPLNPMQQLIKGSLMVISSQNDETSNKQGIVKNKLLKKRCLTTRGTMFQMNSESMNELRKIIEQQQQSESLKPEVEYQITSLRKKCGVETGSIKELQIERRVRESTKRKQRKINSFQQSTTVNNVKEKPATISLQKLPRNKLPLQNKFGVETGFIKELANARNMLTKTSSNKKDIQTDINLRLTSYDECWIYPKEIYQKVSKVPSLSTIKEIQLDPIAVNVYERCWSRSKLLSSYELSLPTIAEEKETLQQETPPTEVFSNETMDSLNEDTVSPQQPTSIREYLALPESYNDKLQISEKIKKIFISKTQWTKRMEKKRTKSELQMFLKLTNQQIDAIVLAVESDRIRIETQVKLKQNEKDEFKQEIHNISSRMEVKLIESQQPLYLLRKEYEKLTNKSTNTKIWNIKRKRKLQENLDVISRCLTKDRDSNSYIMDKITEYGFRYVNKKLQ